MWLPSSPFSTVVHDRKHKVGFVSEKNVPHRVVVCIFKRIVTRCIWLIAVGDEALWPLIRAISFHLHIFVVRCFPNNGFQLIFIDQSTLTGFFNLYTIKNQ